MASISDCNNNIAMYNTMSAKVNTIISYLDLYKQSSTKLLLDISQNYSVNSDNASIYERSKTLGNDVNETSNYLKNTILPAIDKAISGERNKIAEIEAQQRAAAERQRQQQQQQQQPKPSTPNPKNDNRCPICGGILTSFMGMDDYCRKCKRSAESWLM